MGPHQAPASGSEGWVGVTAVDNRRFVEAVDRYRAGIPWRDLPERLGDWKNVHRPSAGGRSRFGAWERIFQHLAADADNEYAMIDSPLCALTSTAPVLKKNRHGPGDRPVRAAG